MLLVNHLSKSYGQKKVLDDISFQLEPGQLLALVGPNGVGKSTLLNIIVNLEKADKGQVFIAGKTNQTKTIFKEMSLMLGADSLYPYLSGYDHLAYVAAQHKLPYQVLDDLLDKLGMTSYAKKRVSTYSLGMKQKLLFALAILPQPKLLILDEPHIGLDPTNTILQREILLDLQAKGTAILLSSHHLSEIELLTQDILFLKEGKVLPWHLDVSTSQGYILTLANEYLWEKNFARHFDQVQLLGPGRIWVAEEAFLDCLREIPLGQVVCVERTSDYLEETYRTLYLKAGDSAGT